VLCISYTQRFVIVGIETDGQRKRDGERERETDRQRERETERDGQSVHGLFERRIETEKRELFVIRFFFY
jgi:hypothetical protein